MTFAGSKMELKVGAGDLRAVDRPLQCKLALEALKSDPRILQVGKLEPAPVAVEVYGTDGTDTVGPEPGATGFARAPEATQSASSGSRSGGGRAAVGGRGGRAASSGGAHAEFSSLFGGAAGGAAGGLLGGGGGGDAVDYSDRELDSTQKHRKKKKKKKTVVVPAAAADGAVGAGKGGGGAASVEYDLPLHVQCVGGKQCSPSLRLKVQYPPIRTDTQMRSSVVGFQARFRGYIGIGFKTERQHQQAEF